MRSRTNDIVSVSPGQVHGVAQADLREALGLTEQGRRCTLQTLFLVLFFAASRAGSIFDACQRLRRAPSDQAVRNALMAQLPKSVLELEERLNAALSSRMHKGLKRRRWPMAIDLTTVCYYGQPQRSKRELRRGKRKAGTTRFHCYATLYLVRHGERFTIAMTYVWSDDSHVQVVKRLLEKAKALGLRRPRYLLLDRGFYGMDVIRHLKSVRCPFLMPVQHRGRRSKRPVSQLKGTRRFSGWKRSGFSTHELNNRRQRTQVKIAVVCLPKRRGRRRGVSTAGRKKKRVLIFAFWGFRPGSPAWVRQAYRGRYGIESSYRQMNQGRARTCSRNPRLRLLLVGIALVLRNVWVWLHRMVLGQMRGRGLQLRLELLRLRTMLLMLQRCAEACLGCGEAASQTEIVEAFPVGSFP